AYTTRVGGGPFPTELEDAVGDHLQERGAEFGATTGRRRRCGWFDGVVLQDAVRLNGLDGLAVTKLDVLSGLDPLKLCRRYEVDGRPVTSMPANIRQVERLSPVYEELSGWREDLSGVAGLDDLPPAARDYLRAMEEIAGVPVALVSVGPGRDQTLLLRNPFEV
ncbi:adenylosuccinate synthase, partial [Dissulfurirhabdus thermomarina]